MRWQDLDADAPAQSQSNLSAKTMRILKTHLPNADFQGLVPEREYWSAETTLAELRGRNYFSHETRAEQDDDDFDGAAAYAAEYDDSHWPEIIQEASKDGLLFSAFGGLIWYLRSLKLERQLLSQRNFARYDPLRRTGTLMLDSQTLLNLDVLQNSFDGSEAGTLFGTLCRCETAFGKRLLKKWICHPLRNPDDINDRLDAVDDVIGVDGLLDALEARFRRLPDIERTISRIHAGTCKPKDFLGVLESLDEMFGFFEELRSRGTSFSSRRLRHLVEKAFPASLKEKLDETSGSFDVSTGEGAGDLLPKREFDEQFADCLERVEEIQKEMSEYLAEQRRATKCPQLAYKDINNEKFQLELPTRVKAPAGWIFKSKTQQVHRYHTPMLTRMIEKLEDAEELLQQARQTAKLRLYQKFDESYPEYLDVVKGIAELDCYLSLARARLSFNAPVCRPEFVLDEGPTFDVKALRHPQFASTTAGQDFIPNDTKLGAGDANIMLLTGANMAGKSTLLRQIGLCVILAQLGSYIPAQSCRLSPCDRIFTRIGANVRLSAIGPSSAPR